MTMSAGTTRPRTASSRCRMSCATTTAFAPLRLASARLTVGRRSGRQSAPGVIVQARRSGWPNQPHVSHPSDRRAAVARHEQQKPMSGALQRLAGDHRKRPIVLPQRPAWNKRFALASLSATCASVMYRRAQDDRDPGVRSLISGCRRRYRLRRCLDLGRVRAGSSATR